MTFSRKIFTLFLFAILVMGGIGLVSDMAFADAPDASTVPPARPADAPASAPANTLGDMITRVKDNSFILADVAAFIAYILAVLLAALGLNEARRHVQDGPQAVPLDQPIKKLLAGGMMFSLPTIGGMITNTFGGGGDVQTVGWDSSGAGTTSLDGMVVRLIDNIYAPSIILMVIFCYIAAAFFLLIALNRLTKTSQQGAQGPSGAGTIGTFMLSGVLFSLAPSIGVLTETLFGGRESYTTVEFLALGDGVEGNAQAERVIASVLAFLIIVGILSIIRGLFVLRGVGEGNQQMTMMSGISHLVAGAILVNMGQFINIVQNTLGIGGIGVQFSGV